MRTVAVCRCLVSLGLIIPRGQCVSGHVVRARPGIRHRNALTEKAWEDSTVAVREKQGIVID